MRKAILLANWDDRDAIQFNEEALAVIKELPGPLHVHLHLGVTRVGKSTMVNLHAMHSRRSSPLTSSSGESKSVPSTYRMFESTYRMFESKGGHESHTEGLWMWTDGIQIWLDMEGRGSIRSKSAGFQSLLTLAVLGLATQVTFHYWGVFRPDNLDDLAALAHVWDLIRQRPPTRSKGSLGSSISTSPSLEHSRSNLGHHHSPSAVSDYLQMPALNILIRDGAQLYKDSDPNDQLEALLDPELLKRHHEQDDEEDEGLFLVGDGDSSKRREKQLEAMKRAKDHQLIAKMVREGWSKRQVLVLQSCSDHDKKWLETVPEPTLPLARQSPYWDTVHKALAAMISSSRPKRFGSDYLSGSEMVAMLRTLATEIKGRAISVPSLLQTISHHKTTEIWNAFLVRFNKVKALFVDGQGLGAAADKDGKEASSSSSSRSSSFKGEHPSGRGHAIEAYATRAAAMIDDLAHWFKVQVAHVGEPHMVEEDRSKLQRDGAAHLAMLRRQVDTEVARLRALKDKQTALSEKTKIEQQAKADAQEASKRMQDLQAKSKMERERHQQEMDKQKLAAQTREEEHQRALEKQKRDAAYREEEHQRALEREKREATAREEENQRRLRAEQESSRRREEEWSRRLDEEKRHSSSSSCGGGGGGIDPIALLTMVSLMGGRSSSVERPPSYAISPMVPIGPVGPMMGMCGMSGMGGGMGGMGGIGGMGMGMGMGCSSVGGGGGDGLEVALRGSKSGGGRSRSSGGSSSTGRTVRGTRTLAVPQPSGSDVPTKP